MVANILVFRGSLQNEGNIWAVQFDEEIFIMSAGCDNPVVGKSLINIDYLKEKKQNIKSIFLINGSPKNSNSLMFVISEIGLFDVPIYGSSITKEKLKCFDEIDQNILKNFIETDNKKEEIELSNETKVSFAQIDSYYPGTVCVRLYNKYHCVYYLDDFSFNVINSNNILFNPFFFLQKMKKFFSLKRRRNCLVTGCQNLSLSNNGSLFFEFKKIFSKNKKVFLILYEFDFLHIIEAFEMAQKLSTSVNVLHDKMFKFLSWIFSNFPNFLKVMKSRENQDKNGIYLLTVDFENIIEKNRDFIKKDKDQVFVYCLFPMSGSDERTARFSDFLHSYDNEFVDLSKNENLQIGTNFFDLKFILKNLNPNVLVFLQNSYKNNSLLDELKHFKPKILPNSNLLNISFSKKFSTSLIKSSKKFMSTENLLSLQRDKLLKNGLLVVFINAFWKQKKIVLSNLKIFSLSLSDTIDFSKLEKKIRQWWDSKINSSEFPGYFEQNAKQIIEKRLSGLVKGYLSFENDVEMEEPLFLTFIDNKKFDKV